MSDNNNVGNVSLVSVAFVSIQIVIKLEKYLSSIRFYELGRYIQQNIQH